MLQPSVVKVMVQLAPTTATSMANLTVLASGVPPATAMAVVVTEDTAMAVVSTALDTASDTNQVMECMAQDTPLVLCMAIMEGFPLVQAVPRVYWLPALDAAVVPVEPPDPVPPPVPVPAGSDVLTSLWRATRVC